MLWAFIDEAGDRSHSANSSAHFVMSAVVMDDAGRVAVRPFLAQLRQSIGRQPGQELHWRNIKKHPQKIHIAQEVGKAGFLTISTVVVCKRHLPATNLIQDQDTAYLFTLRFLLERLSWLARDLNQQLDYTLAHIRRFRKATLRLYEANLRGRADCKVEWGVIPRGGRISTPKVLEELQLADITASATFRAFEPDQYRNTERRYLTEFAPRLYRRGTGANALTSYGLKMHPWNAAAQAAYGWITTL